MPKPKMSHEELSKVRHTYRVERARARVDKQLRRRQRAHDGLVAGGVLTRDDVDALKSARERGELFRELPAGHD